MSQCLTQISLKEEVRKDNLGTSFESTRVNYEMKIIFLSVITEVVPEDVYYVKLVPSVKGVFIGSFRGYGGRNHRLDLAGECLPTDACG